MPKRGEGDTQTDKGEEAETLSVCEGGESEGGRSPQLEGG